MIECLDVQMLSVRRVKNKTLTSRMLGNRYTNDYRIMW